MKRPIAILPDPAGLYGLFVFLFLVRFAGSKTLADGDTLWHIKFGEMMLKSGRLITNDPFSHTAQGQPWLAHEWLAEIFAAGLHQIGGLPAVAIGHILLAALAFNTLFLCARRISNDWAAFAAISLSAAPMATTHLLARPHLFSWLLGALTLYCLLRNDRTLWALPLLTALWGNLHGGVLLGLVLQGAFLVGRFFDTRPWLHGFDWKCSLAEQKRPLMVLVLSILATGCNPFGFYAFLFNFQVNAEIFAVSIGEWRAADFRKLWYVRYWLVGMFLLAALYPRKERLTSLDWTWIVLLPILFYQAMTHVRHISIAAMFAAPWLSSTLQTLWQQRPRRPRQKKPAERAELQLSSLSGPTLTLTAGLLLLVVCWYTPPAWQEFAAERFSLPVGYSQEAVDYIAQNRPGQRLLNEYSWGDYLIYALDPPPSLFIDGRADMYGEAIFGDYRAAAALKPNIDDILERYEIDWILFPKNTPLVRYLERKPDWQAVYSDDKVVILALTEGSKP
ncbi:MAG: hypothetical protein RQ723_11435 [Desulfuromonadales bacterium]|nr:hypothetical protein [Desulfuromonadales bacterium]